MSKINTKILTIQSGFYYFGTEVEAPEGYIKLIDGAMFGGFSGGKGMPGIARGDKDAKVTLDRFGEGQELLFPLTSVVAIADSIDLYKFKNTTLR